MTTKSSFNAEEWALVARAPFLVGLLVIAADTGGTVRESVAITRAYGAAREHHVEGLMHELIGTPPSLDPAASPVSPEELRRQAPQALRQALKAVAAEATDDELVAYKRFVFSIADAVARAHREGGFMGIGGTEISEHEQEALDEIAKVLDEA